MKPRWKQVDWKCWGLGFAIGPNERGRWQFDLIVGPVQAYWDAG